MEFPLTVAAVLAFIWGVKYLQAKKRQEERQMIHRERILAMEKGIPLPEFPLPDDESPKAAFLEMSGSGKNLLSNLTLGCGVILVFSGAGIVVAFIISPDHELRQMWSVGLIPLMVGIGALIYYILLRVTDPSRK